MSRVASVLLIAGSYLAAQEPQRPVPPSDGSSGWGFIGVMFLAVALLAICAMILALTDPKHPVLVLILYWVVVVVIWHFAANVIADLGAWLIPISMVLLFLTLSLLPH